MSSPTLIDDSDPAVQYSHNWTWVPNLVPEVDHTRHGVSAAGQTASLAFTGTGIQVFGTLEPSNEAGQPTTQYAIDGNVVSSYTAPFTPPGAAVLNVTFFSKLDLSSGSDHEIVITNINGTSPNMFWLDYFLVYTSPSQSPTQIPPSAATGAVTASPSAQTGSRSISVKTAGAIVGGVAGGLVFVIALLLAYIARLRYHKKRAAVAVQPFRAATSTEDGTPVVAPRSKATARPRAVSLITSSDAPIAGPSSMTTSPLGPVVSISASRVNVTSSTGTPSENATSTDPDIQDNESGIGNGSYGALLRRPGQSHRDNSRGPGEAVSQGFARGQARPAAGQGDGETGPPLRSVDSGLRLYDPAMLPPSYSSS